MADFLVIQFRVFPRLCGEEAASELAGTLDIGILFLLVVLASAVGGDDEFRVHSIDFVFKTVEPCSGHFDFVNPLPYVFELPLITENFDRGDGCHAGLEALCRFEVRGDEFLKEHIQAVVPFELESDNRVVLATVELFQGDFQGFLT